MTSSNGNIFSVTDHLCGEFTGPVTRNFDVFFDRHRINYWVNNREAGDLRRYCVHYDVIVMDEYWVTPSKRSSLLYFNEILTVSDQHVSAFSTLLISERHETLHNYIHSHIDKFTCFRLHVTLQNGFQNSAVLPINLTIAHIFPVRYLMCDIIHKC